MVLEEILIVLFYCYTMDVFVTQNFSYIVIICLLTFQRMHDMFIQSQHSSNSSSGVALQQGHKKRKVEHQQQVNYSGGDNLYSLNAGSVVNNVSQSLVQRHSHRTQNTNNNVQHKSPSGGMPQQFIRASTIKLLDTYQRCGQKVSFIPIGLRISSA